MRRNLLFFGVLCLSVLLWSTFAWSQCHPNDNGMCDTLYVEAYPPDTLFLWPGHFVRVPIYVTHDVPNPVIDSIEGFNIPLCYTQTNLSGYCSVSSWWNNTDLYPMPTIDRSIFRHLPEHTNWMMALSEQMMGREWDTRILEMDGTSYFRMLLVPTSAPDQRFGPGSRVLLATMTFRVGDTTTVCVDSCFWPPSTRLSFTRSDAASYIPRHNMPYCFRIQLIGPQPDFTIEATPDTQEVQAGTSVDYDVILTSLCGFASSCILTVSGLPADASGSFDPNPVTPTDTSAMTINTAKTTPPGTYDIIITATEITKAQIEHSTQVVLIVTPPPDPRIISITDVGNDQGKQVRVKWERCYYDSLGSSVTITEYSIWRRVDQYKSNFSDQDFVTKDVESFDQMLENIANSAYGDRYLITKTGDVWDFIATVPAMQFSEYSYVAPTLADSTYEDGMYWSVLFVAAHTEEPLVHYDSDPDSGYSVDNIPPLPILDLEIDPSSWFTLKWTVPGEYVGEEPISSYDIRYSPTPVGADTQAWWDNTLACTGDGFFNLTVGEKDSLQVAEESGRHPEVYFAIKGLDSRPNASGISNILRFKCGDSNGDGVVDIGDVVYEINYLFRNGDPPEPMAAGDVNCDGIEDIGDVVYKINYLFRKGDPPCSP